jgi:hypothetical protein
MCVDAQHYPNGQYVGHDEPSLEFKSGIPGSGNDMTYTDGPQPDTVPAGHASHSALASCPAGAVAPDAGGIHSDEVRRYPLDPRLQPSIDERRALGLGIQMVRRSPC